MNIPPLFVKSFVSVAGSQIALGVVGILALPFAARGLGIEKYGEFSFFLIIIGFINSLEFGRILFIKEYVSIDTKKLGELAWISLVNVIVSSVVPFAAGLVFLSLQYAPILAAIGMFQALAAPDYAWLANNRQIGFAVIIRNSAWAAAYITAAIGTYVFGPKFPYPLSFLAANVLICSVYRLILRRPTASMSNPSWLRVKLYMSRAASIYGFNLAAVVAGSTDRIILQDNASADVFGQYMAQADLSVRFNLISRAIGQTVLPFIAASYQEKGIKGSFQFFKKIYWLFYIFYFVVIFIMILFHKQIISLVFGRQFIEPLNVYPLLLLALFINLNGYMFVPWSQAVGNFNLPRNASLIVAIVVLSLGFTLIPLFGAYGAVLACLSARITDVIVAVKSIADLPSGSVKKIEIAISVLGILVLTFLALTQLVEI